MSNALEAASLIMVPSGYEDGTLASVKPNDGTGDFTFSRGSNLSATRVGPNGYIEKGYENLLLQSNSFLTTWTTLNASLTTGQAGYDGSNNAWKLIADADIATRVTQSYSTTGIITTSVYAKAAEWNYIGLYLAGPNKGVVFSLIDGSIQNPIIGYPDIYANGENIGNGWWRFSITHNASAGQFSIYACEQNVHNGNTPDGVSGIYIQDAMLNQGLVAYPYIETTTAPVAGGILEDEPRLDWASGAPSLLLEPSRTNLINYSEPFEASGTPNWRTQNGTIVLSDEKPYFLNTYAAKYVPTSTGFNQIFITLTSLSVGSSYVNTYYLKPSSGISYLFFDVGGRIKYNVSTNALDPLPVGVSGGITQLQDGWLKATFIYDSVSSSINTNKVYASITDNFTSGIPLNEYLLFTACQFEQGSYPTSYIPTYGVSQTRLKDNVSSLAGLDALNSAATIVTEFKVDSTGSGYYFQSTGGGSYVNINQYTAERLRMIVRFQGVNVVNVVLVDKIYPNTDYKLALRYDTNKADAFLNGENIISRTGTWTLEPLDELRWDFTEGNETKQVLVFPTALSDSECIQLTTV